MEYAPITSTTWDLNRPAASTIGDCGVQFTHEPGCPMQGSTQDCTCYVSRIRLIKTPGGDIIPTTEPDRRPDVDFWRGEAMRARRSERHTNYIFLGMCAWFLGIAILQMTGIW